jgi:predicted amidohydrolase YtcJ
MRLFTEKELGTLEVGKRADLTVVDRDVMRVPPPEILTAQIRLTVVGGEIVYDATTATGN